MFLAELGRPASKERRLKELGRIRRIVESSNKVVALAGGGKHLTT